MTITVNSSQDRVDGRVKLAYLVSHPIQYQAPLLRRIAQEPDIDLTVLYSSDFSLHEYRDSGFGVGVEWGVPLLGGYRHKFLAAIRDQRRTGVASIISRGILKELRAGAYDALWVHGYTSVNSLQGMLAAKAMGIPVLLRAESWLQDRSRNEARTAAKRVFFAALKGLVDGVLPIGLRNVAYWRHYLGDDFLQFLMPYAVDNEYFQQRCAEAATRRGALLKELDLDPSRPVILFAAKLQKRKRCEDLIEAYKSLCSERGGKLQPSLVIVGDGEERIVLEAQVEASGLRDVRFCGFRNQSELPRFFDLASVFVLPSRHEPWGLVVNEVMNAGKAVIVSDEVGCQPDLITDGCEGCIFAAGDVGSLTNALRRVLIDQETARRMGERALERIRRWSYEEDVHGLRRALAAVTRKIEA